MEGAWQRGKETDPSFPADLGRTAGEPQTPSPEHISCAPHHTHSLSYSSFRMDWNSASWVIASLMDQSAYMSCVCVCVHACFCVYVFLYMYLCVHICVHVYASILFQVTICTELNTWRYVQSLSNTSPNGLFHSMLQILIFKKSLIFRAGERAQGSNACYRSRRTGFRSSALT